MRVAIALCALLLLPLKAQAQVGEHRSELAVGVSAGCLLSNVGFMPNVPQTMHTGLTGGMTFRYTSEKYFSSICAIVAEMNYAQVGWKEDILKPDDTPVINAVTGVAEAYQRDMSYLQVPVMARLGWGRERKGFQFFFQVGPQLGVFLGDRTKSNFDVSQVASAIANGTSTRTSGVIAQDTMAVERRVDYGITGGIGLEFSHPKVGHFLLEGRYYYGLGDIYGNSKRDYFARSNFSNIIIKLSWLVDLSKTRNSKIK